MTRSAAWPYNTAVWRKVRLLVLERDGYMCQVRGPGCELDATHVDHIVPWRVGGAVFDSDNLRASCRHCNLSRVRREGVGAVKRRPSREW